MESSTKPKIGLHTKNQLSIPKMAKWTTKGPKMSSMPHCAPPGFFPYADAEKGPKIWDTSE